MCNPKDEEQYIAVRMIGREPDYYRYLKQCVEGNKILKDVTDTPFHEPEKRKFAQVDYWSLNEDKS